MAGADGEARFTIHMGNHKIDLSARHVPQNERRAFVAFRPHFCFGDQDTRAERHNDRTVDLIGVAAPAALFPDELKLCQLAERRRDALLTDAKLLRQRLAGKDHKHFPIIIHPAVAPRELKAVQ